VTSQYRIWSLLVRILFDPNSPGSNQELREKLIRDESFWQEVISMSNADLVTSELWTILRQKQLEDCVSPNALEYLESLNCLNINISKAVRDQALECIEALNRAGIVPMPIKGVAYQLAASGEDVLDRFLTDIDIMVPAESASRAQEVLCELDYRIVPSEIVDYGTHHHLEPMWRESGPVTIEIHRSAVPRALESALPCASIWKNASSESRNGIQFRLPSPTDSAMVVFLHNVMCDRCLSKCVVPLRSFLDADRLQFLYGNVIDWDKNLGRISKIGARSAFRRFAYIMYRLSGRKFVDDMQFTRSDFLHYQICHLAEVRPALADWAMRFERLSNHQLRKSYDVGESSLSIHAYRMREIGAMLMNGMNGIRRIKGLFHDTHRH